jgi:hypothetical protein
VISTLSAFWRSTMVDLVEQFHEADTQQARMDIFACIVICQLRLAGVP